MRKPHVLAELLDDPERFLDAADAELRRLAVSSLAPRVAAAPEHPILSRILDLASADPDAEVRAEAAEVAAAAGVASPPEVATVLLRRLPAEESDRVVEAIATALGELEDPRAVPALLEIATVGGNSHVREAAVAALGAIGDPAALDALIDLTRAAPPQVRRRAVVALTAIDAPEAEAAIAAAREDRNPMVREVAEMIVGRADDAE